MEIIDNENDKNEVTEISRAYSDENSNCDSGKNPESSCENNNSEKEINDDKTANEKPTDKKKKKSKKSEAVEWAKTIIIPVIIALLILQVVRPTLVQQQSMLPTVEPNDYLIVYKLAYKLGEIKDGDIIVFKSDLMLDENHNKYLIKRVIAKEGETIQITDGKVYVNGKQLDESYINGDYTPGDVPLTTVPQGCVFVMGDNRPNSTDSRDERVGFVTTDRIMGKVIVRLFPFSKIGSVY